MPKLPGKLGRWLLRGSDPSVRYRVLRTVLGRPASDPALVDAARAIGREGWAAGILAEQLPGGQWATSRATPDSLYHPKYTATNWRLLVLSELGVRGTDPRVRRAVDLFLRVYASRKEDALGGPASEACFTGNAVRLLVAFGRGDDRRTRRAIDWIVRSQKPDGGWHCFPSKVGTLDAWEPLAALAALPRPSRSAAADRAAAQGAEFFLDRALLHEGRGSYAPWLRLHYPTHYYYDLLVGLTMLVRLGYADDRRLRPALARLEARRRPDGSWALDALHPDVEGPDLLRYTAAYVDHRPFYPFALEMPGLPSRWITAGALEVLRACGRA
ncbi:MAG TPA: hypothetical protein VEH10_06585 [Thermoplasmata archaeon]|nr:hypothetical protein [Thermoplasmata archaeon]